MNDSMPGGEPPNLWAAGMTILVFVLMAAAVVVGIVKGA